MKETKEKYVYVNFQNSKRKFIYKTDLDLKIGNIVEAPILNYAMFNNAIVVKIVKLKDSQLPIEKQRILQITKLVAEMDKNGDFDKLKFIKQHIKREFLKEWKLFSKDNYVKIWKSTFDYNISYEKDATLEVYYIAPNFEDSFEEYTITSKKHLKQKIAYVQTITSEFYNKIIDLKTFKELLDKLGRI